MTDQTSTPVPAVTIQAPMPATLKQLEHFSIKLDELEVVIGAHEKRMKALEDAVLKLTLALPAIKQKEFRL